MILNNANMTIDTPPDRGFFGALIIHHCADAWGNILVLDHSHYRNLTFNSGYEQSSMDKEKPSILVHEYTRAMMLVLAFIKPRHVTLLGLGGGCLLRSLHHTLPQCKIHAVELRQRVYEVAVEFFGIPENDRITITIADAKLALENADNSSTQIIFADMYHADGMEPYQLQKDFIAQCHRVLSNQGWLVVNYHDMPSTHTFFVKSLCRLFADVFICQAPGGNNILLASKHSMETLEHFDLAVATLEKKLKVKLVHLFERLTKIK